MPPAFNMTATFMLPACPGAVAGQGKWHGCTRHPWGQSGYAPGCGDCYYRDCSSGQPRAGRWVWYSARLPSRPCKGKGAATFK
jgi:hypothetical protein